MRLTVYKGFKSQFLSQLNAHALVDNSLAAKKNVLGYTRKTKGQLYNALLAMKGDDEAWLTYEEFSLIQGEIKQEVENGELELTIVKNNIYPDSYPLEFSLTEELVTEIRQNTEGDNTDNATTSPECEQFLQIYNSIYDLDGQYFGSFYNYEVDYDMPVQVENYYDAELTIHDSETVPDFVIALNDDMGTYLQNFVRLQARKPQLIGVKTAERQLAQRQLQALKAFCGQQHIEMVTYREPQSEQENRLAELVDIVKNDLGLKDFQSFHDIQFYQNPDVDNSTVAISQAQIITEIIQQAECAYDSGNGNNYRDLFITASTGAGKSLMFQVPAVYLAKKYHKLTIIIEPVIALMEDQKRKLQQQGYMHVEAFNSNLITYAQKEDVIKRIKAGEIDLLYLSPETLLSYSINSLIGDREIGLFIVDEAHIVTTWGVGFRPDYWYLGGYINRLRHQLQYGKRSERKIYHFPLCAFTATAVNGGEDDSVSDTIVSLNMENPIKHLGAVRRDDIKFDIEHCYIESQSHGSRASKPQRIGREAYKKAKAEQLQRRILQWSLQKQKTVVYFPYATLAYDAYHGRASFEMLSNSDKIALYISRNLDGASKEIQKAKKDEAFEQFRSGNKNIMFATKAFGMGVDVDDIKNVYHYAVTGTLFDYVQEVGRAARRSNMQGQAIMDYYPNDLRFMKQLFGMSSIKQYQIKQVLVGVYAAYKNKKAKYGKPQRNFLISPSSFTYIFGGKDETASVNMLKTCLLMLEKDLYDTYSFKVLIARPQSVFTTAYVCVDKEHEKEVLYSRYGAYLRQEAKGRFQEQDAFNARLKVSDTGDIYKIDLKGIWERYYADMSFPQFKYWYFNANNQAKNRVDIMPEIRAWLSPRQKLMVDAKQDGQQLAELWERILTDLSYIADVLWAQKKRGKYFSADEMAKILVSEGRYSIEKARIIAHALFDLVDPEGHCVKRKEGLFSLSHGGLKEVMRKHITRNPLMRKLAQVQDSQYAGYIAVNDDNKAVTALKILSLFDYISYDLQGGEEPEIFIRLNSPEKIARLASPQNFYANSYVTRANKKHERDVKVLERFFVDLHDDKERWDYIENYFLGNDVLAQKEAPVQASVPPLKPNKKQSFAVADKTWAKLLPYFDESEQPAVVSLAQAGLPVPDYLSVVFSGSDLGNNVKMYWQQRRLAVCAQDTTDEDLAAFATQGIKAYRLLDVRTEILREVLQ